MRSSAQLIFILPIIRLRVDQDLHVLIFVIETYPPEQVNKIGNTNQTVIGERGTSGVSASVTGPQEPKGVRAGNLSQPVSKNGLCFTCHSPGHKQVNCPMRRTNDNRSGDARVAARNFACAVQTAPRYGNEANRLSQLPDASDHHRSSCVNDNDTRSQVWYNRASHTIQSGEGNSARTAQWGCNPPNNGNNAQLRPVAPPSAVITHVVDNTTTLHSARTILSDCQDKSTQNLIANGLSKLNYVPVCIRGIDDVQYALNDSGSEINLIHRNLVQKLTQLPSRGRVKIKGIVGPAVETDIVLLDVSPAATEAKCVNIAPPLSELFAVCDDLNEQIILTADTVNRLSPLKSYESLVVMEPVTEGPGEIQGDAESKMLLRVHTLTLRAACL